MRVQPRNAASIASAVDNLLAEAVAAANDMAGGTVSIERRTWLGGVKSKTVPMSVPERTARGESAIVQARLAQRMLKASPDWRLSSIARLRVEGPRSDNIFDQIEGRVARRLGELRDGNITNAYHPISLEVTRLRNSVNAVSRNARNAPAIDEAAETMQGIMVELQPHAGPSALAARVQEHTDTAMGSAARAFIAG